jgi:hypothetical protein
MRRLLHSPVNGVVMLVQDRNIERAAAIGSIYDTSDNGISHS